MLEPRKDKTVSADVLFFPVAAAFSAVIVPLWMMTLQGWIPIPSPYWHGHEMLFGYGFAVVSGYLITRVSLVMLSGLFLSWFAARLAALGLIGDNLVASLPGLIFVGLVVYLIAPPFLRAAKKAENRVFGPLFMAMGACELIYQLGAIEIFSGVRFYALLITVDLFSLLLLLMGGRMIASAMAGHFYRTGQFLIARVQPRLERIAIILMISMILLDFIPKAAPLAGVFALGAAVITIVRIGRWQVWRIINYPHLWGLILGYTWLALGLALKGFMQIFGNSLSLVEALHGITIGAIGTLTLVVMARTRLQRNRQGLEHFEDIGMAALLVSLAALLRLSASLAGSDYTLSLLWASAIAWFFAFSQLLYCLIINYPKKPSTMDSV
ncbi:NnrS family protein [Candidatus Nitrosoglobus terrae]|uniref:NnrS family protein n=1 Tax=Candidatus Nitrosoglobus terrae TaxID=1630141 RepID=A0A1Q2SLV5_9GAMM|nr:NnrS family protein [Candidatus Nitrosoglobus terrae]BAW80118.1 NnrS family protein [Candidatus Nitrosoglobus terrae]